VTLVNDLWTYRGLVGNLAQRELKAKYKRSILGWAWSLINPATTLAIYAVVFGILLKVKPPVAGNGTLKSFALYLFAGLVIWNFFQAVATGAMSSLIGAGPLLKKVFFPAECAPAANLLVAMSQSAIEATILVSILIVVGNAGVTMLMVPVLLVLLAVFSFGVGLVLSVANVYYRDVNYLVAVLLNLLFYATPIVYPESLVKDRGPTVIQWAVAINPLNHFVESMRSSVYALQWPSAIEMLILLAFSFGTFLLGWAVFHRFGSRISEEI
jgi:ABC-2 type transport system permease protein